MTTKTAKTKTATIQVAGLKVAVPLSAEALPRDLVPTDGPAGEPTLDVMLEGSPLALRAKVNGKNYRKLLKQVDEHGAGGVAVVLQVLLRPPATPGGPFVLEGAGFQAIVKAPRPAEPSGESPVVGSGDPRADHQVEVGGLPAEGKGTLNSLARSWDVSFGIDQ